MKDNVRVEGIRGWYRRKTRGAIRALWATGLVSAVVALAVWCLASQGFITKLQTWNGAMTIPLAGGIWIVAFLLVWLVPMREVSFRGQETLEAMHDRFESLQRRAEETLDRIDRIARKIEDQGTLERIEDSMAAIRRRVERDTTPLPVLRRPEESQPHHEVNEVLGT